MLTTQTEPLVDVLVAFRGKPEELEVCLRSIICQSHSNLRVHLFDDANGKGVVDKVLGSLPPARAKICVYTNANRLFGGISSIIAHEPELRGRYWANLDGDDYWVDENKIAAQVKLMETNTQLIASVTNWLLVDELRGSSHLQTPRHADPLASQYFHTSAYLWRNRGFRPGPPWPEIFDKLPRSIRGDTLLAHLLLVESEEAIGYLNLTGSAYRYSGSGKWSGLSQSRRAALNRQVSAYRSALTKENYLSIPISRLKLIAFLRGSVSWMRSVLQRRTGY